MSHEFWKRETVHDKIRPGRPVTATTDQFQQTVSECLKSKEGASIRKTDVDMKRKIFPSPAGSVYAQQRH